MSGSARYAPPALQPEPLPRIGEYVVHRVLGKGAMGAVYLAQDRMGRLVALKQVHPQHMDENGLARFLREGQALAALKPHPNVVGVHALGESPTGPYLVMDLVQGETLKALLLRGSPPPHVSVALVAALAEGVEHLHQAGVVHRDLKPANVLIRETDGAPVLTDFGLAHQAGANRLTQTGEILGTPLYMSPEQLRGQKVDALTDVWALGAILYELLTGRTPFLGKTLLELAQAAQQPPPTVRSLAPHVDVTLSGVVERALGLEPEERWSSAGALAASLRAYTRYSEGQGPAPEAAVRRSRSMLVPLVVSFLLAVLGVGGVSALLLRNRGATTADDPGRPTPEAAAPAVPRIALSKVQEAARAEIEAALAARDWPRAAREVSEASLPPETLSELRDVALATAVAQQPWSHADLGRQLELLQAFALRETPAFPLAVEPVVDWNQLFLFDPGWAPRERVARLWTGVAVAQLCAKVGPVDPERGQAIDRLELLAGLGLPLGDRAQAECAMDTAMGYAGPDKPAAPDNGRIMAALTDLGAYIQTEFMIQGRAQPEPGWQRRGTPGQKLLYWRRNDDDPSFVVEGLWPLVVDEALAPSLRAQAASEVMDAWDTDNAVLDAERRIQALAVWREDLGSPFLALPYAEFVVHSEPEVARSLAVRAVALCDDLHGRTMTLGWSRRSYSRRAAVLFAHMGDREQAERYLGDSDSRGMNSVSYYESALKVAMALHDDAAAGKLVRTLQTKLANARAKLGESLMAQKELEDYTFLLQQLEISYHKETGKTFPAEWREPLGPGER